MLKPNVVIGGDSWGCGEWPKSGISEEIKHKGLEQYFFENGFNVTNTSKPNSSNKDSILRLKQANLNSTDIVIWIQSDPLRDLRPYDKLTEEINAVGGLRPLLNKLIQNSYSFLNSIGAEIYLIGGLFNIRDVSLYSNLHVLIPSWIDLLIGNMPEYSHAKTSDYGITMSDGGIKNVQLSKLDPNIAGSVINDFYYYDHNDLVFREDIFQPDGCHPNRYGHRIVFDKIVEKLKL